MKWLLRLFCLYVLLLSCLPCADGFECNDTPQNTTTQTTHTEHQHEEQCPPFCACACCGRQLFSSNIFIPQNIGCFNIKNQLTANYKSNFPSTWVNSIWQPPKI